MAGEGKALKLILIVLILISMGVAGVAFYNLQQEQAKNTALQSDLDALNSKQKITETKLEESKKMITSLENKIKENSTQIEELNHELSQAKTEKDESLAKLEELNSEVEAQKKLRSDLEDKLSQIQNDAKNKEAQLNELVSKKSALEAKIKELEEKAKPVELGKIVVTPESTAGSTQNQDVITPLESIQTTQSQRINTVASGKTEGKILVVNKEYSFLVINLGSKDGIKEADEFVVYHNDANLGVTKVEKVHDYMSSLGFTSAAIKDQTSVGDRVVKK